jgi:hypothetical protein
MLIINPDNTNPDTINSVMIIFFALVILNLLSMIPGIFIPGYLSLHHCPFDKLSWYLCANNTICICPALLPPYIV